MLDQPLALPVKQGEEGCAWLESIKPDLQPLGLVSTKGACALSVQLGNGQIVQVDFVGKKTEAMPRTCVSAQLIMAVSMVDLITGDG
ncbi:hypothetical protein [Amycolatopsis decaplanina]|uniref:Uncharacterized protein n=1 Tax=Amycolatopsis decaplanina DSM 44594 TaxID=1284240 RepID=M2ZTT5_9PSEU|nr:hypothetical protein [Amycolatopsis decaplanina]EME63764.1 hypothetical protein H074_04084 [Amycolatopsis decaplanina DSM 44594]